MPQSLIRGSTQILDASITAAKLAASLNLPSSQLQDGANFLKKDGSVALTADWALGNFKLTSLADATNPQDAVNLRTAQALINGIAIRRARAVVTTNVTLSGVQNFDGLTGVAGDRIFLTGQTTQSQNGLWVMNAGAWTRPTDWAAASSQKSTQVLVEEGTVFHDTKWIIVSDNITVDTTAVTATQDLSGTSYINGNGLSLTGNVFAVKLLSTGGLSFDGSQNIQIALDGTNLSVSATGLKIANSGSPGQVMIGNASNVAAFATLSGDIATITGAGAVTLATTVMKSANYIINEAVGGTINGVNTAFTLANTPITGKEAIYLNGQRLFPGAGNDYTITAAAITMAVAPQTGDRLTADYIK